MGGASRPRQAGVAAVRATLEGVVALVVAGVAGQLLFEISMSTYDVGPPRAVESLLVRSPQMAVTVAVAALAVVAAPLLGRSLRAAGGWAVVVLGLVSLLVSVALEAGPLPVDLTEAWVGGSLGLVAGGVLVALVSAAQISRWAIAVGLVAGLPLGWWLYAVSDWAGRWLAHPGVWLVVAAGVVALGLALAEAVPRLRAGIADKPLGPAAGRWRLTGWPVVAVGLLAAVGLAGGAAHLRLVKSLAAAEQSGLVAVESGLRVVTAVGLGAALVWYVGRLARRHWPAGRAALVQWSVTCLGVSLPLLVGLEAGFWWIGFFPEPRPVSSWLLAGVVIAAAAGGLALARARFGLGTALGTALGLLVAAAGLWLLTAQWLTDGTAPYYLLGGGVGLALGAGLGRVLAVRGARQAPGGGAVAVGLALGLAGALLVSSPLAPFGWWIWEAGPTDGLLIGWRYSAAALVAVVAFGSALVSLLARPGRRAGDPIGGATPEPKQPVPA